MQKKTHTHNMSLSTFFLYIKRVFMWLLFLLLFPLMTTRASVWSGRGGVTWKMWRSFKGPFTQNELLLWKHRYWNGDKTQMHFLTSFNFLKCSVMFETLQKMWDVKGQTRPSSVCEINGKVARWNGKMHSVWTDPKSTKQSKHII